VRVQAISEYLIEQKVGAVLAQFGPCAVEMMPACEAANVPLLAHFHGYDAAREEILSSYGKRYRALFAQAHGVIAVSREMHARLVAMGASPARLHYIPYGVDTDLFAGANPADNGPDFLMVGRQVEKKGHLLALLAFAELVRTHPECTLRIVGSGPLRESGEMLARALGIAGHVRWLGVLSPSDVAAELRASRALIQFSHTTPSGDQEGTPLAVLEAMSSGIPVVGSRHAGIPDVIEHEVHGLLVDSFDLSGLTDALRRLADAPALAAGLGQAAAKQVHGRYTRQRYLDQLAALIDAAIARPPVH
jgi:glycosyltransferase involved in cell wall biosynthesis